MNLKEMLAKAKSELASVKEAVENGEKGADELSKAIDAVKDAQAKLDAAKEAEEMLKSLGDGSGEPEKHEVHAKTIGEHFVKHAKGHLPRGEKFAYTAPVYKAATDVQVTPAGTGTYADALTTIDKTIHEGKRERNFMAELFGSAPITEGNSVTYFVEGAVIEGDFAAVAENGKKPQIHFPDPVEKSETLRKIAGYYKVSDEVLADAPRLAAHINGRALYRYNTVEDDMLLNGTGTGNQFTGVLNVSGIQATTYANGSTVDFDTILDAIDAISNATDFDADAIIMNRADYSRLMKTRKGTTDNEYLIGNPFGNFTKHPPIWGVDVYTTSKIAAGTILVGAFKEGGTIYRKDGLQVAVYNQNEDDAIHNRVTIVVEGRLTLGVEYPAAFVKITEAA